MPHKVLGEIHCDCCGFEVMDGEKVYYDNGVILHFRPECLSDYYSRVITSQGKTWSLRLRRPLRLQRKTPLQMLIK